MLHTGLEQAKGYNKYQWGFANLKFIYEKHTWSDAKDWKETTGEFFHNIVDRFLKLSHIKYTQHEIQFDIQRNIRHIW